MKHLLTISVFLIVIILSTANTMSQSVGDYRSAANGNWNSAATWETWNGSAWVPAANPPAGSENITVDDTVGVDIAVNISGYVTVNGIGLIQITGGSVTFTNGSTYEQARNAGGIPISTWSAGSICKITGTTNQAPANRNQNYHHLIFDTPGLASNLNMGFNNNVIGGNITIVSTSASSRWQLCGPQSDSTVILTIMGDVIHLSGNFSTQGTGNGNTTVIINHYGNITATSGNFSVARGSQGGTGTTSWFMHNGSITFSDLTTQNSNPDGARFIFTGTNEQNLMISNLTYGGGGLPIRVDDGATVNLGSSVIEGNGVFIVNDFGGINTTQPTGFEANLLTTGTITLSTSGNYGYNGNAAQVTGLLLPVTVNNLTIANNAGVALSQNLTVNGNLNINNGDLNLSGQIIDLGFTGTLIETAGNTVTGTMGWISAARNLNAPSGINVGGLGVMFTSTDNLGDALITRFHTAGTGGGNEGIFRQYTIEFLIADNGIQNPNIRSGVESLASTLRFYYDESELNNIPEANLTLFNSISGANNSWVHIGGTVNTTANYVEVPNVTDYSFYWTLANVNAPIPVELTLFTALANVNGILLEWSTASETNNTGWNIERKHPDQSWQKIGFVEGNGTSTTSKNYSYFDDDLSAGKYQYRLQQIDYDGSLTYSDIVELDFDFTPADFALYQNYPNPFNPSTAIKFDVPSSSFINLSVYNAIGEKVATLVNEQTENAVHSVQFDAGNLPSGIYIYRLTADHNVFTKKMVLVK